MICSGFSIDREMFKALYDSSGDLNVRWVSFRSDQDGLLTRSPAIRPSFASSSRLGSLVS